MNHRTSKRFLLYCIVFPLYIPSEGTGAYGELQIIVGEVRQTTQTVAVCCGVFRSAHRLYLHSDTPTQTDTVCCGVFRSAHRQYLHIDTPTQSVAVCYGVFRSAHRLYLHSDTLTQTDTVCCGVFRSAHRPYLHSDTPTQTVTVCLDQHTACTCTLTHQHRLLQCVQISTPPVSAL